MRDAMVKAGIIPKETAARVERALTRQREIREAEHLRLRADRFSPPDETSAEPESHAATTTPRR